MEQNNPICEFAHSILFNIKLVQSKDSLREVK